MPLVCARFHIRGHVQGVSFRAGTQAEAVRLGISGHARNLRDGRVEVLAQGPAESLDALETWLQRGPAGARVDGVDREQTEVQALRGFLVR
jgi:acylphosphatase